MGRHDVDTSGSEHAAFTRYLLRDLQALERMHQSGMIESGVRRIGAEQEMFLVDRGLDPAPVSTAILEELEDPRLTTELALFNLEANLTPRMFGGSCLRDLQTEIENVLGEVQTVAQRHGASVGLVGILPTLRKAHAGIENMTPVPRYAELNRAMLEERGGSRFNIQIRGLDQLETTHDNVMLESCNTSFQLHIQVSTDEFPRFYNAAQLITAPLIAAAANSPLFLGQRLWAETRVALFERSVDGRSSAHSARGHRPRVQFGDAWVHDSALEIFRDDVARYRVLLSCHPEANPLEVLASGRPPKLEALQLHNGTVYRWNRPCYGVKDGIAHLRIENRVLPAGPSVVDEIANAALFFGLVCQIAREHPKLHEEMSFDDAKTNFFAAARHGLDSQIIWIDNRAHSAPDLVLNELLPKATEGLREAGVDAGDIDHYLGVMEERVRRGRTGARWMIHSLAAMPRERTAMRCKSLTAALMSHQSDGKPVHEWELAHLESQECSLRESMRTVGQIMSTDLFTVRPGDIVDLAASIMTWEHVRHVPVEDDEGHLVGLISYWGILRLVAQGNGTDTSPVSVEDVMRRDPVTVGPETPTVEAVEVMQRHAVSALPVVDGDRLVGIVTERDLIQIARRLLERYLRDEPGHGA